MGLSREDFQGNPGRRKSVCLGKISSESLGKGSGFVSGSFPGKARERK